MRGCWQCGGEGFIVVRVDDMCRGAGYCIHGDGEAVCPNCKGDDFYDEDEDETDALTTTPESN